MAELRGLCKEEAEGRWDVARQARTQCSELGKFVIARAEVGDKWKGVAGIVVAGIEVAGKGWQKSSSRNLGFAMQEQNGSRHPLSPFPSSLPQGWL
jgi:hypothetical protein